MSDSPGAYTGHANNVIAVNSGSTGLTYLNTGTSANSLVQLDSSAKLPAIDGSQLTNLPSGTTTLQALTISSGLIAWNLKTIPVATLSMSGNATLSTPTNMASGGTYYIIITQDSTGSRILSFGSNFKWAYGVVPILSTAPNSIDVLTFISDGTYMYGILQRGFI